MYLWKLHVTAAWLLKNEGELPESAAIIDRRGRVRSLVQVTCKTRAGATELARRFGGSFAQLPRDWEKQFLRKEIHAPLRIGRRLLVVEQVQEPSRNVASQLRGDARLANNRAQLVIPAAGAFGTGEHATTAMSLRLLEETTRKWTAGWRILDVGTGTGILALAARCFGAREIVGLDHDPRAVSHARANAELNRMSRIRFVRQDLADWKPTRHFDLITANLFSELLIAAAPKFRRALHSNGHLIVSGILREQAGDVARALRRAGFAIELQRRRGKWIVLLAATKS